MNRQSLAGAWSFRQAGTPDWLPATVPGGVHTDLLALGRIPDPFASDNELRVQWVAEADWEYRRVITVDETLLAESRVFLVGEGLDTVADVVLNGTPVGHAENMYCEHRWQVRELLRAGENVLEIRFASPVREAAERDAARHLPRVNDTVIPGGAHLRKAASHFGWDWAPRLPAIGIWRDIRFEGFGTARLDDVHLRQLHERGRVTLSAAVRAEAWGDAPLEVHLALTAPDGGRTVTTARLDPGSAACGLEAEIGDPELWYPNGYGAQPLYRVEVALLDGSTVLDRRSFQVGLRTIELREDPDEWGRSFQFVVNGVPVFAKGANWIPSDSFPSRVTGARLEHLVRSAAEANHNMLRAWGGGYYEDERFFDLCDRYGILVWQDFMFACAVYPFHDPAFLDNVRVEVSQAVRRLRHRACLALWCGNNEMETGWVEWGWSRPETEDLKAADQRFFYGTLPAWLRSLDPDHPYWPSSPSSHDLSEHPNSNAVGDNHLWDVWHALKPISHYRTEAPRFASEFGLQSLPALPTIDTYADPADRNMTSYVMEHHQRHPNGNGKIVAYLTAHYRLPTSFSALVYLTQVLQAEGMRVGVEHWRRIRARCSGALYWQLNDCWPVASWSSIDHEGRWKALHYASRRFYAPVLLSIDDEGDRMGFHVTNDTTAAWEGEVRWTLETLDGDVLEGGVDRIVALPSATTLAGLHDLAAHVSRETRRGLVVVAELWQDGARRSLACLPLVPDKHVELRHPEITLATAALGGRGERQLEIRATASSLARFVELALDGADVVFTDNFFDLPAGREVRVACPIPDGWSDEQACAAVRVRSLFDSYQDA